MKTKVLRFMLSLAIISATTTLYAEEPTRPATVPQKAVWVEEDNEWALGKRNEDGKEIGEWKWWLAPTGHLVCHTIFDDSGTDTFTYKRYHQDGTVSREGKYVNGEPEGITISTKSKNETTEVFNPRVDSWKAVTTFKDGYVVEEHYYDENGIEVHEPYIAE